MVETIAPVVYGGKRRYLGAVLLHAAAAAFTGASFGALLGLIGFLTGAPWGDAGLVAVAVIGLAYAARELLGLPLPLFDRKKQVPDWWRTFYSPHVAATLYGAGLGIGFLTFLRHGTYVVVCSIAVVSGNPLVGVLLGATFGLTRGLTALMSVKSADEVAAANVVTRLEGTATTIAPRVVNGGTLVVLTTLAWLLQS